MNPSTPPRTPQAPAQPKGRPEPVDLAEESVAGEEDPGAALDITPAEGPTSSAKRNATVPPADRAAPAKSPSGR